MYLWSALMLIVPFIVLLLAVVIDGVHAFQIPIVSVGGTSHLHSTRRDFVDNGISSTIATICTIAIGIQPQHALASGGATAGGAYLLSAKQRYNARVIQGVSGFVGLKSLLEKGDIESIRKYFSSDESGLWKDFTAAGYLLANAFRTNSSAAPDSLPSVKKWKAFTSKVEIMTKALKKQDMSGALLAHGDAIVALDEYLAKVDLSTQ